MELHAFIVLQHTAKAASLTRKPHPHLEAIKTLLAVVDMTSGIKIGLALPICHKENDKCYG